MTVKKLNSDLAGKSLTVNAGQELDLVKFLTNISSQELCEYSFFFIKERRDNLTLKEGELDFEVNIYLQAQPAHDLSLVEPAQPPAYL